MDTNQKNHSPQIFAEERRSGRTFTTEEHGGRVIADIVNRKTENFTADLRGMNADRKKQKT
jgi:hypothetical protein